MNQEKEIEYGNTIISKLTPMIPQESRFLREKIFRSKTSEIFQLLYLIIFIASYYQHVR